MLPYTIYSGLVLAALYLTYKWMLADERQHAYNRGVLLSIYAVALATPVLAGVLAAWAMHPAAEAAGTIDFDLLALGAAENAAHPASRPALQTILWIYVAGVAVTATGSVITALRLTAIIASGEKRPTGKYVTVLLDRDDIAPFSWRNFIVMSRSDYESAGGMILAHECEHLRLRHWLDLLLAQAVAVLMWYNPAAWLMRGELKTVHEYQADECALSRGINARDYQMLLIKKAVGARFPSLANSLNHSKLKKRITMMYNPKTSAGRRLRVLTLAPALAVAILGANVPFVANAMTALSSAELSGSAAGSGDKVTQNPASAQNLNPITVVGFEGKSGTNGTAVAVSELTRPASFPGGEKEMIKYLLNAIKYPEAALKSKKQGNVAVRFNITEDGSITNAEVINGLSPELDAEALRVVNGMPKWIPAISDGKAIATAFVLPITFRIPPENNSTGTPTVIVDGKAVPYADMNSINPDTIESITVKKDDPEYPEGVIYVTLKK